MPSESENAPRIHTWAARRDIQFLRSGIDLSVRPIRRSGDQRVAKVVLTNLAGHAYPTATRRRALRLEMDFGSAQTHRTLATFVPNRLANNDPTVEPALAPGAQRSFSIAIDPNASQLNARLIYVRNRFEPDGYQVEINAAQMALEPTEE